MNVSYALNVAELIILAVATYLITGNLQNPYLYIAILFGAPFFFRRSIYVTPG